MRGAIRWIAALVFGLAIAGVFLSPLGRVLEKEYGLPLLYSLRGPIPAPPEALIIGLDNQSVRWLNARAITWANNPSRLAERAPRLHACLSPASWELLLGAANINHVPRPVHACLIDALIERNARLISFDINFNKDRPGDGQLAAAIRKAQNVLLFERFSDEGGIEIRSQPKAAFREAALGTMAFRVDSARGQMVTAYRTQYDRAGTLHAMPDEVWMRYTGATEPQASSLFQPIWLYGPPLSIRTVPLMAVFDPESRGLLPDDLTDVVVFIGSSDPEDASIDDHFPAPTSGRGNRLIGGVELAATAFLNRLHGTTLDRPGLWLEVLVVFLVAALGAMGALALAGWRLVLVLAGLSIGWLAVSTTAFIGSQIWLPVTVPVFLTAILLTLAALSARYMFVRTLVERLAPRQVAAALLGGTVADRRAVKTEPATVMFTDLVGSTGMAEDLDEFSYSDAVSQYYDLVTEVIEDHGGMVVEFMGDGVLALFPLSVTGPDHAARSCEAARHLMLEIGDGMMAKGDQRLEMSIRIGINSGLTATGDIGAKRRFNFKALGDVVNVAARLEQLAKQIGDEGRNIILLSGETKDSAGLSPAVVEDLGERSLRGRKDAVPVFRLRN
ncbi:MAG: adenylate/guanylate cyclase domain-containing protein [Pseudomonadota bacterium]